jgi:hypothetical protein
MATKDSGFVNLGREYSSCEPCCAPSKSSGKKSVSYPTLYISGCEGLDISTGEITFTAKGKVVMVSDRETNKDGKTKQECSVEIEIHSIKPVNGDGASGGLEEAIEKIASSKTKPSKYMGDGDDE